MTVGERLQWIEAQSWPTSVKERAKELFLVDHEYKKTRTTLDELSMSDERKPSLMYSCGRQLRRLGECYQALAQELAYERAHGSTPGFTVKLGQPTEERNA